MTTAARDRMSSEDRGRRRPRNWSKRAEAGAEPTRPGDVVQVALALSAYATYMDGIT